MADVTTVFAAKDESFDQTVKKLQQSLQGFGQNVQTFNNEFAEVGRNFTAVASKGAALVLGFVGVSSAFDAVKQSFNKAAEFQELERRFATLLGSAEAAKERMASLATFMDTTPFELPGIVAANIALQNFTQGALATEDGMRDVGDAASALGVPLEEMAELIGRTYAAIQAGQPIGQMVRRMTQLAVITPEAAQELSSLNNDVEDGARKWSLIEQELSRFSGAMKSQSTTWNATMSGFGDAVDAAMRSFAAPLLPPLTAALQQLADTVRNDLAPGIERAMGAFTTDWLPGILNGFTDIRNAGSAFNQLMITGAAELGNALFDNMSQAFRAGASGYQELMNSGSIAWLQTLESTWYIVADKMAVFFMQGLQGILSLVSGIIPGAQAAADALAEKILEATGRIERNMFSAEQNAAEAAAAFAGGANSAEFIEHNLFDSQTSANKVAEYLAEARENGSLPTEGDYRKVAEDHAPEIQRIMAEVELSAKSSETAFANIKLDLEASNEAASSIKSAFDLSEESGTNIKTDLNNTADSGDDLAYSLKEGNSYTGRMAIDGTSLEESGAGFAREVKSAEVTADRIYNMFVGPGSLLGAFNDAMQKTQQLQGAIDSLDRTTRQASTMRQYDTRADAAARAYERAEQRAANQRERGLHNAAENTMRQARETYTKNELSARYEAFSKILLEEDMQAAKQAATFEEQMRLEKQALENHQQRMQESADYVKNQMEAATNQVEGALKTAANDFFNVAQAGRDSAAAMQQAADAIKGAFSQQQTQLALESTLIDCREFLNSINEKLPQHSLS